MKPLILKKGKSVLCYYFLFAFFYSMYPSYTSNPKYRVKLEKSVENGGSFSGHSLAVDTAKLPNQRALKNPRVAYNLCALLCFIRTI